MQENFALRPKAWYTHGMNPQHPYTMPTEATPATGELAGVRRRPGGRSARVQAAVFVATIQLLQEKGYEALSFATVAERAGVHETSLYRRWKTKEQLVINAISGQVAQNIPVPDTGAFRSDLIQLLQLLRTFLQSSVGEALVQLAIVSKHAPEIDFFHQEYWRQRRALLQPVFDRAMARGEVSPQADLQLLFETLIGVFYARAFVLGESLDETLPERVVDLVLSGGGIGKSS
jgi:AcrR family transcriptional regulator